jgi:Tfp pilus assembly protein PilF
MGRLMEALADLDRAIEIDPRYTGALVSRGKVYRARGEDEVAHTDFDLALAIDPEHARIWIDEE